MLSSAARESIAAHEGRHTASARAVEPSVNHNEICELGTTITAISTPVASALRITSVRGTSRFESAPTSHTLANTIGTATQAMNSDTDRPAFHLPVAPPRRRGLRSVAEKAHKHDQVDRYQPPDTRRHARRVRSSAKQLTF